MRLSLTVVDPIAGRRADGVLDADPQTTVADLVPEFLSLLGARDQGPLSVPVFVDSALVNPALTLEQSPLREGVVVSLQHPAGCPPPEPTGVAELRVVSGPAAGAVHRLGVGRIDIGKGAVPIRVDDAELAGRALTLRIMADGTATVQAHSADITIDGVAPQDPAGRHDWPLGAQLAVGNSLLELTPYFPPDAALKISDDGAGMDYNRPPRLRPPEQPDHFRLPRPPEPPDPRPLPWITAFMPLVGAVMLAVIRDRWIFLLLAILTPVMLFANYYYQKKKGGEKYTEKLKEYKENKARVERDAQAALVAERFIRRHAAPDPATVLSAATGPRTRLWERRRTDEDHLLLRVGTAELDSSVVLTDPELDEHRREVTWRIADAPVTIPLATHGVVGFAAPGDMARSMGRWAVGQLAVLHSPLDVQFYVLTDNSGQEGWEWLRWLPHARPTAAQGAPVLLGNDAESVGARVAELTQLLEARAAASRSSRGRDVAFGDPDIVIVLDGSRRLRSLPGVIRLLKEGPAVSIYALCLDDEERFLPGECQAVAVAEPAEGSGGHAAWEFQPGYQGQGFQHFPGYAPPPGGQQGFPPPGTPGAGAPGVPPGWPGHTPAATTGGPPCDRLRVEQAKTPRIRGVRPDLVATEWANLVGRSLSPLRDISGESEDAGLPSASRLLDVLQMEPPNVNAIIGRWQMDGQSTLAVLGESYDGPFAIDLRRDGPHGLIAGTTGSGKSELLQTIVASLAVANTPENMTFVLVDYKGGSAFKDCVQLPHTVGMVTDLDNHLVERALRSLGAELTRREHILAGVGAKDIEDYQDLARREPGRHQPMPRLLIVIDEFASMVRELPDFVKGLVNIAQRGRSLGIHLLLATQRPSGVVSPEIRANTNLRIALRVTDPSESTDVIDSPEASAIAKSTPGRAYVRLGHASLVPFQSGRVGGRRPGAIDPNVSRPWSADLPWAGLGRPQPKRPAGAKAQDDVNTDLKVLVETVIDANQRLGLPRQHSPWLPPLPDRVLLHELPAGQATGPLALAPYGIEDRPEQQSRHTVGIDFKTFGHLFVAGSPRMGRSQLLRTIAGSLALTHSSEDVHLYAFDCGNGALNVLTRLPHCGAVVSRSQVDRAKRLLKRLEDEVNRRQEVLSQDALADITEQRATAAPEDRLPHIVVLVDRWEGWTSTLGEIDLGALTDQLQFIMREGASVGIHAVITGDQRLLSGRISSLSEDKFAFRLADRADYASVGLSARKMPEDIPPGRLFRAVSAAETQVAVLSEDLSGQGQAAALTAIAERVRQRDAGVPRARLPFRVDVLPQRLTLDAAWEMRDPQVADSPLWGLVGVGGDELTAFGPDLGTGIPGFVIAGPPKSGRSTVLRLIAMSLLRKGVRVVISAPRVSPMRELEGQPGVLAVHTGAELTSPELRALLESSSPQDPIVMLMDDAEDLRRCKADDELRSLVIRGAETGRAVVVAGDAESVCSGFIGWQAEVKKARRGVLLSPQSHRHGDLIGAKLSRSVAVAQPKPGQGILHLGDGNAMSVRIPVP